MRRLYKLSALLLCLIMLFTVVGCSSILTKDIGVAEQSTNGDWQKPGADEEVGSGEWDDDTKVDVTITEIGGDIGNANPDMVEAALKNESVYKMVHHSVEADLKVAGFTVGSGIAVSENDNGYAGSGLYYYSDALQYYEDSSLRNCGFVEIGNENTPYVAPGEEETICIYDTNSIKDEPGAKNATSEPNVEEIINVYNYDYENLASGHFIYKDQYIQYYRDGESRITYKTLDNVKDNYDLSIGTLFNYDTNTFIYDDSIFDDYKPHSGSSVINKTDYAKLEAELQRVSAEQEAAGYMVEEFTITYISVDAIKQYLDGQVGATFFGYDVDELVDTFGIGKALVMGENGLQLAPVMDTTGLNKESFWKKFLTKMAIGTGIILVGAALAPITGGASFGCALMTISSVAITSGLAPALVELAVGTTRGLQAGKSMVDSLKESAPDALNAFADGFMVGAAIGAVGVNTGLIKPTACFTAGTLVAVPYGYKAIESIQVGDSVLSYNEDTGVTSYNEVTDVFVNQTNETIVLSVNGNTIETTASHPFYLADREGWIEAKLLNVGDKLLLSDGTIASVESKDVVRHANIVDVYNFTVANDHTYYVGEDEVLVHNNCAEFRKIHGGAKAQRIARRNEVASIYNGTNKNSYPADIVAKIQGEKDVATAMRKHSKEFAAHHIIPVETIKNKGLDPSLVADQKNLLVLLKDEHKELHHLFGRVRLTSKEGYFDAMVKLRPYMRRQIAKLMRIPGVQ